MNHTEQAATPIFTEKAKAFHSAACSILTCPFCKRPVSTIGKEWHCDFCGGGGSK